MPKLSVKIEAVTKGLSGKLKSVSSQFRGLGATITAFSGGVLAGVGIFTGFASSVVGATVALARAGGNLEQTRIAFETFFGSSAKARQVVSDLRQFADVTPFKTSEILKAGKALATVTEDTKDIIPTIKMLGDISSGTGKDLNELVRIFVKMKNFGRLTMEELNQLANANVISFKELAKSIGINEKSLRKYVESGKVGFDDVNKILNSVTSNSGKFGGLMERQSRTLLGRWSTLMGTIENTVADLGEGTKPLGRMLDATTKMVRNVREMRGLFESVANFAEGVAGISELAMTEKTYSEQVKDKVTGFTTDIMSNVIGNMLGGLTGIDLTKQQQEMTLNREAKEQTQILKSIDNNLTNKGLN